jgi:hypothetical protein
LLDRLDLEALRLGVTTFTATTQSDNRAVLALVQATAHDVVVQMDGTETQLRMAV